MGRKASSKAAPGCMGGVLHYLHFHHLLFAGDASCCTAPFASPPPSSLPLRQPKGLEAPRNSLELDEKKSDEFKEIPVGIEIVASKDEEKKRTSSRGEAAPRTPGLVARLMGLETSPPEKPLARKCPWESENKGIKAAVVGGHNRGRPRRPPLQTLSCNVDLGTRSLPESPRASTSARAVDADRRLSLQINRLCQATYFDHSKSPKNKGHNLGKLYRDENKSPRNHHHSREMVKRVVKEIKLNETKASASLTEKKPTPAAGEHHPKIEPSKPKVAVNVVLNKCNKADSERFTGRIKKQHSKSGSLSTLADLFQSSNLPDTNDSKAQPLPSSAVPTSNNRSRPPAGEKCCRSCELKDKNPSFRYEKSIFDHAMNSAGEKWRCYSGSSPVDPLIFHRLELEFPYLLRHRRPFAAEEEDQSRRLLGPLRHRWNRKPHFHLVQEILAGDASASEGEVLDGTEAREVAWEVGLEILDGLLAETAGELGEASYGICIGEQTHVTSRAPVPAAQRGGGRGGPTVL
ncbi:uncharacterized protein LOC122007889 [Zingiber officinale]|uniref:DUF3741 domain-containing protein n=1 Tax=Zingiber officinale TaxID=94328 RepID=A0A8J5FTS4_ZINOF|nr:uncharacterized protein LOC122007889 [Zingiber officinale]KAG6485471.1 hypothetical protein ZIOFF_054009 [Zingiber officinale]